MTKRRHVTLKMLVTILERQAICPMCGEPLGADYDLDHEQALARGGADDETNLRAVHRENCHRKKTKTDVKEIAKTKRLTKSEEAFRSRLLARETGEPRTKKGKIPSRPFRGAKHAKSNKCE